MRRLGAIDSILAASDDDEVFVEAFEDVAIIAASGEIGRNSDQGQGRRILSYAERILWNA